MNDAGYQQLYCKQTEILISLRDSGDTAFESTNSHSHVLVLSHRFPKLITPGGRGRAHVRKEAPPSHHKAETTISSAFLRIYILCILYPCLITIHIFKTLLFVFVISEGENE